MHRIVTEFQKLYSVMQDTGMKRCRLVLYPSGDRCTRTFLPGFLVAFCGRHGSLGYGSVLFER